MRTTRHPWLSTASLLVASLMSLCFVAPGCATQSPPDATGTSIVDHESEIRLASALTTTTVLISVDEKEQAAVAQLAYQIADVVERAAVDNSVNIALLEDFALKQVSQSNSKYKVVVGTLVKELAMLTQAKLDRYFASLTPTQKQSTLRVLLKSVAAGVKDATASFRPSASVANPPVPPSEVTHMFAVPNGSV
jgi:hypothetical protein